MAMAGNINAGQSSEWALLKRHESERLFGLQIASGHPNELSLCAKVGREPIFNASLTFPLQILEHETQSDFVDLNCGCPIDAICNKGAGSALLNRPKKLYEAIQTLTKHLSRPLTVKIRTGWDDKNPIGHKLIPEIQKIARGRVAAVMMHGRSRLQRYTGSANWEYILTAARSQDTSLPLLPIIGASPSDLPILTAHQATETSSRTKTGPPTAPSSLTTSQGRRSDSATAR
jgi:tRNA-dihydrouridine synthase 3